MSENMKVTLYLDPVIQQDHRSIYDFLQSPEINKRSSLRSRDLDIDSTKILRYKSINHDDYSSWKQTIYYCKHYY